MPEPTQRTLVICDGGLPSIVAAAIEAERAVAGGGEPAVLMPWPTLAEAAAEQMTAAASLARFLRLPVAEPALGRPDADPQLAPGVHDSLCLLAAAATARQIGCSRVVWPVQYHNDDASLAGDLGRIAGAADRALLFGRLGLVDAGGAADSAARFETPLVDLTDAQIADLVVDLDAPAYLAWWWRSLAEGPREAAAAAERRAWMPILRGAGWAEPPVTVRAASEAAAHQREAVTE